MNTAVNWNLIREARLFLHLLNEEQKAAFLTLAYRVSLADGEDDLDEVSALEDIKAQMYYDGTPEMSEVPGDLPLAVFQTPKARAVAMMELLMIKSKRQSRHSSIVQLKEAFKAIYHHR